MTDSTPRYPGIRIATNGNQLVSYYTEARVADAGVFYPITPSTEMGEHFQLSFARGELNVFGRAKVAVETEGEHAAQAGAIAYSVTGKRVVNFTSGQGVVYALEQYYHAPGKLSTMVVQVAARPFTKHALNVHCGHDDIYCALDTGWNICFAMDAQQAADQSLIMRKVNELSLTPGINGMDGFLTSHLERTFRMHEAELIREYLGSPEEMIDCPTPAQAELFGPKRRRVPECYDLKNPALLGSVQNQEHYMGGLAARRHHFVEPILGFFEEAFREFGELTGRHYGLVSEYNNDDADVSIVCLGSAAENCQAAVDYLKEKQGAKVGVVHINLLRPFPEEAVLKALRGKKQVIVLERSDDQMAGSGPLGRDIRTALAKARDNHARARHPGLSSLPPEEYPEIFEGIYGLGSRDFRPEGILGAYEFVTNQIARQDGKKASDGVSFFYVGINHPYNVESDDKPSLLPDHSIAVRMHSIGGWGMITTGKNLGAILGDLGTYIAERDKPGDDSYEALHISANPKYGSEKKGAPTNYFLTVAPDRIRVNCDLRHVNVVLCCDPKIFTHSNPLVGLSPGGAFIWESSETDDDKVWERIPRKYRKQLLDSNIQLYVLDGFKVARDATDRVDLEYRMQGNSFLGSFFKVSTFLTDNKIPDAEFLETVEDQYNKKFGRFGKAVVDSNMTVMRAGFEQVRQVALGKLDAPDTSSMRGPTTLPIVGNGCGNGDGGGGSDKAGSGKAGSGKAPEGQIRPPLMMLAKYDEEYRGTYGYDQPSSPHASTGVIAAATGATKSQYVSRRQTPKFIAENCTQCMACITACPDNALPNVAQDVAVVLSTAANNYVKNAEVREHLVGLLPKVEEGARTVMREEANKKKGHTALPFHDVVRTQLMEATSQDSWFSANADVAKTGMAEFNDILGSLPLAYANINAIFRTREKKNEGSGGIFGIFVNDLCKGCAACVYECGDHNALVMVDETEDINGEHETGMGYFNVLADTSKDYLGTYDPSTPMKAKAAVLQNHLMQHDNYNAMVCGDGACAGCGEKSALRAIASLTEAYLRPVFHLKAERLEKLAASLKDNGRARLAELAKNHAEGYAGARKAVLHLLMGYGGENDADTDQRIAAGFKGDDGDLIEALVMVLEQDAFNHRNLRAIDGGKDNGMSVMAMTASTGCNTVYGSTHPNNPHPYPWMNSLFQDGATIGWLVAESFIDNHGRRSVVPERIGRHIMEDEGVDKDDYFTLSHLTEPEMTSSEINELPRVWAIGGDGAFGDIGFQNVSKTVLQNRPNMQLLLLDTQVYSNTGGQNSDSSPMPGGFDMNQFGQATEGKLTEKKGVAEILISGHGSPYVAQISMATASNFFAAVLGSLAYRGTGFLQCFTTCQPEHGVGDDMAIAQAILARDSRGVPEFVFDPQLGESYEMALSLKGNRQVNMDWMQKKAKDGTKYAYTVAHWAHTEARFRRHFFPVDESKLAGMLSLDTILWKISQQDVVHRNHLDKQHRAYVPKRGIYTHVEQADGSMKAVGLSRQMVLFCVERRKAWRMLQSKAGVHSVDLGAQAQLLSEFDAGKLPAETFHAQGPALMDALRAAHKAGDKKSTAVELLGN